MLRNKKLLKNPRELVFLLLGMLLMVSCKREEEEKLFRLLSPEATGINFSNDLISSQEMNILEYLYFYNGGGVAIGDINNDGLQDIYFTSNQGENKLYLNLGNLQFEDITASAGVSGEGGWSTGATMADVNGDGLLDIYVCQVGDYKTIQGKNRLYINNGDGTFADQARAYGIDFVGFSTHALFFDYDQDGDLDLYLLNHSIKKPEVFSHSDTKYENQDEKGGDRLFKNLLAEGEARMVDVTTEAGILSSSLGFGLGVGMADVNGDGWMDLYVSNDFTEDDYLYINQQDGTFLEMRQQLISNTSRYSMGNDLADINNDALPDIFTTDMLPEDPYIWMKSMGEDKQEVIDIKKRLGYGDQFVRNHLQLNSPSGMFREIALLSGTHATDWSWSPLIFDMDNDGWKDIHVTNGIVKRPNDLDFIQYSQTTNSNMDEAQLTQLLIDMLPSMKLANFAFRNSGGLKFENVASQWGLDQESYSNGSAYADLDNDGDLDLVINNINQTAFVYENRSETFTNNHFIQLDLLGSANGNQHAIGAQVEVYAGDLRLEQTLSTSRGFQSGGSTILTFGLGSKNKVDSVVVRWDHKHREVFQIKAVGQKYLLKQGEGMQTIIQPKVSKGLLQQVDIDLPWTHLENIDFDEFRREYLMPQRFGTAGPALAVGDINGDGLEDLFLGGARNQPAAIFLQRADGKLIQQENPIFTQLQASEDVVAQFIDLNGDGHLDLYVGSGGNEHASGQLFLFDKVFMNDGKGNLRFSMNSLPPIGENTGAIAFGDFNGDGFPDLFVGGAVVAGDYGAAPQSYLLQNDGSGKFKDVTPEYLGTAFRPGMVQAALWTDMTGDGKPELVIGGHWMQVQVYSLSSGKLEMLELKGFENSAGWIYSMLATDLDGDGQVDLVLGNKGLNSKLKASSQNPLYLYHGDFDNNGQADPLIFHYMEGRLVPFGSRDDLIKQVPALKRLHDSYQQYASIKSPGDLFDKKTLEPTRILQANRMTSGIYWNQGNGSFSFEELPIEAQFAPIMDLIAFEKEGLKLLMGLGNHSGYRSDLGQAMAAPAVLMAINGRDIKTVPFSLKAEQWGEFRKVSRIMYGKENLLIGVRNNQSPVFWK
jgi:enediyne biosynthesis protein E4